VVVPVTVYCVEIKRGIFNTHGCHLCTNLNIYQANHFEVESANFSYSAKVGDGTRSVERCEGSSGEPTGSGSSDIGFPVSS
jgi:hypothetical protein